MTVRIVTARTEAIQGVEIMRVRSTSFVLLGLATFAAMAVIGSLARAQEPVGDPYPLEKCIVCEQILDDLAVIVDFFGREIRFCKEDCRSDFESGHDTWIRTIDERITDQQRDVYPLKTCVVCDTPLEESAELDEVFLNRLFRLCSYDCQEKLKKGAAKYFDKLNRAVVEKQKKSYPLKKCIVSGKPLGDEAVDHVVANQLVRLADYGQIDSFNETPGKYLAKLREVLRQKD